MDDRVNREISANFVIAVTMRKIYKTLFYTILIVVYGVFFSVESFYNFEGAGGRIAVLHAAGSQGATMVKHSPLPYPSAHNLRLNKRFHQEDFRLCPVYQAPAPVCYVTPRALGIAVDAGLPFVTLFHLQLRGPPFAV